MSGTYSQGDFDDQSVHSWFISELCVKVGML